MMSIGGYSRFLNYLIMKRDFLILEIVLLTAMGVGGATVVGAVIGFLFKNISERYKGATLGSAAGVMLSASVFSLIIPSLEYGGSALLTVLGIFCGGVTIDLLDRAVQCIGRKISSTPDVGRQKVLLFVAAIAIHNLPEGIAAGVGFGSGNFSDAMMIAGGIALQNIPEGMVLISPMLSAGFSAWHTFAFAALTGLVEVLGAFLGYYAVSAVLGLLPFALAFAGGCMLYVIFDEMIPEARLCGNGRGANYSAFFGFSAMILFDAIMG